MKLWRFCGYYSEIIVHLWILWFYSKYNSCGYYSKNMVDFPKGFNELAHAFLERFSSAVAQTLTLVSREGPEVTRFVQKFCLMSIRS